MGIKEDYQKALTLAKRGYFKDARALLLPYDNEKTNALLRKIETAIQNEQIETPKTRSSWGVIKTGIALVIVAGLTYFVVSFAMTLYRINVSIDHRFGAVYTCDYLERHNTPCDTDYIIDTYTPELAICLQENGKPTMDTGALWATCLRHNGVQFSP